MTSLLNFLAVSDAGDKSLPCQTVYAIVKKLFWVTDAHFMNFAGSYCPLPKETGPRLREFAPKAEEVGTRDHATQGPFP